MKMGIYFFCDAEVSLFEEYNLSDIIKHMDFKPYEAILKENIELRGVNCNLSHLSPNFEKAETLEIIKHNGDFSSCITIGFWEEDEKGYNFKFVDDRFMANDIDKEDLMFLIEKGQAICAEKHKLRVKSGDIYDM